MSLPKFGIGVLGASSKYRTQSVDERKALLKFIFDKAGADFIIDTATVYGDASERYTNALIKEVMDEGGYKPQFINKIGASNDELEGLQPLLAEFDESVKHLGSSNICYTLLHRPSLNKLQRDTRFYHEAKQQHGEFSVGICTHDASVLKAYAEHLKIDMVQVAANLLDYKAALPVLNQAKKLNIPVLVRSALSSGLLGGKYGFNDVHAFTDDIRVRYNRDEKARAIYAKRVENVNAIKEYYEAARKKYRLPHSFSQFCYSAILGGTAISSVLLGGSRVNQIAENMETTPLPQDVISDIYTHHIEPWASDFI